MAGSEVADPPFVGGAAGARPVARGLGGVSETLGGCDALAGLRAAIDELATTDAAAFAGRHDLLALTREIARLEAVACRQAEQVRRRKDWLDDGAATVAAWVAGTTRVPKRVAARRGRIGRWVEAMAHTDAAFRAGTISIDHVEVLVAARNRTKATAAAFARHEAQLVTWACTLRFDEFRRRVDAWLLEADEDGAEDRATTLRSLRRFHLSQSIDDLWFGDLVLDPVSGEIVNGVLTAITRELFEHDWASAKAQLGTSPTGEQLAQLTRTPAQRRADAIVEMATRAATVPAGGRRPQPLFTVLVGEHTFARVCELASGTIVTPGSVAWWLDDAIIERIVFDGPDRVLAVGQQRAFRGALRRAVQVVHRRCTHRYCDVPAAECEIDHIHEHSKGGPTSLANGQPQCGFHNRRRNGRSPRTARSRDDPPRPPDG